MTLAYPGLTQTPVANRLMPPIATIGAAGAAPAHSGRAFYLR